MNQKAFEVEQKFFLGDRRDSVIQRLLQLGATWGDDESQADHYFNHPQRDFAQTDEAVRIRTVGEKNWLTYKGPKLAGPTKTRQEIETPLGDGASTVEQFSTVLTILGFRPVATVRKHRRSLHLATADWQFVIAIDEVDQVGQFLEIELLASAEQLATAQNAIVELARRLELSDVERRSYLRMLLENQHQNPQGE